MKHLLILISFLFIGINTFGQQDYSIEYAETITQEDLRELLTIIASDAMEGRETGERGQKMAAAFIADHFERLGLEPVVPTPNGKSYYQKFNLERSSAGNTYLKVGKETLANGEDVLYFGGSNTGKEVTLEVVFGGDGSKEALANLNLNAKAVLFSSEVSSRTRRELSKIAYSKGAALVLLEGSENDEEWNSSVPRYARYVMRGSLGLPQPSTDNGVFYIGPSTAANILNLSLEKYEAECTKVNEGNYSDLTKLKSGKLTYAAETIIDKVPTENIMGYLEGTDKKDELIVLTAHYDHIGRRGESINNGADDDGSGTSAILELAEAYVYAKKAGNGPRRSILFMTVTGEEKGLLGSQYYTENPVFPLENTVVDLNIDMIGRSDEAHVDNREFVYLVGSDRLSSELHELSEKANNTYTQLSLDYTYNDESHPDRIYYRSDHWNFAKNNIPIIFYFNGTHDDYHRETDTVDKIEFDLLQKRAQLVFYTSWIIANREDRLVVDKIKDDISIKTK
jgi:hypothetical protein